MTPTAFVLPSSIAYLVRVSDWETAWLVLAGLFFSLSVIPAVFIRRQPEDLGMIPGLFWDYSETVPKGARVLCVSPAIA